MHGCTNPHLGHLRTYSFPTATHLIPSDLLFSVPTEKRGKVGKQNTGLSANGRPAHSVVLLI